MTHYWWMHWFWITSWISLTTSKSSGTLVHSNLTTLPLLNVSDAFNHTTPKPTGGSTRPPTTIHASNVTKPTLVPKNITYSKYIKTSQKKIEFLFSNGTTKNKTKDEKDKDSKEKDKCRETVINVSENVTDNQVIVNASFIAITSAENLTYLETNVSFNQSSIQNSERLGVEEDGDFNVSESNLSAAGITGITLGCVVVVGVLSGISYFIYRNRGFNRPQVLNDRCSNPDSSGYIDDASVRDNSEEMYSLDNDSFLNSLEAMTIQNYWTDTVKHTKL